MSDLARLILEMMDTLPKPEEMACQPLHPEAFEGVDFHQADIDAWGDRFDKLVDNAACANDEKSVLRIRADCLITEDDEEHDTIPVLHVSDWR